MEYLAHLTNSQEQEIIEKLNKLAESSDYESAHVEADGILCEVLIDLGYIDIVRAYGEVGKWYA